MSDRVVIGAAAIHYGWLFVARRARPTEAAGRWELPGDLQEPGEDDMGTLSRVFAQEFSRSLSLHVERILPQRLIGSWRIASGNSVPANLQAVRCSIADVLPTDIPSGIPFPNLKEYDASRWIRIDDLDSVDSWRYEDRMLAADVVDYYNADPGWHYQ